MAFVTDVKAWAVTVAPAHETTFALFFGRTCTGAYSQHAERRKPFHESMTFLSSSVGACPFSEMALTVLDGLSREVLWYLCMSQTSCRRARPVSGVQ